MVRRILLASDGSASAKGAEALAEWLGYELEAQLVGLFVRDSRWIRLPEFLDLGALSLPLPAYHQEIEQALTVKGEGILGRLENAARMAGVNFARQLETGVPAEVIVQEARTADLVVLGRQGENHPEGQVLGSTAERVVRASPVPVLLAPPAYTRPERLLIGYNGSEPAVRALHFAAPLAVGLGLGVRVLSVDDTPSRAEDLAREGAEYLAAYGLKAEPVALQGDPAERLLELQGAADLLALGAFGGGPVRRWLLGSTTEYVLRSSPAAVLVVR
ncbi:MAG: universal stress protein [Meiothermus sp.]